MADIKQPSSKEPHDPKQGGQSAEALADNPTRDNIVLGDDAQTLFVRSVTVGLIAIALSLLLGLGGDTRQFLHSYLTAFMFGLQIVLGAVFWLILQHLVNATWSVVLRRVGELIAANATLMAVLALPIVVPTLLGNSSLYPWADTQAMQADHLLHHKAPYLNVPFFAVRFVIYFVFWAILSRFYLVRSLRHDEKGDQELLASMGRAAPICMILFALTLTFAAFDFLMSLSPTWFSTIFGVYYFAGCVIAIHSFMVLAVVWLQSKGRLAKSITTEHYHDLGKMMFAFTIFWAYIAFSQFMLQWYANVPEETEWYKARFEGGWAWVSAWLLIGNFAIPFFGLLSRHAKRNKNTLAFWSVYLLVCRFVDMCWLVKPKLTGDSLPFHFLDVTCVVGIVSLIIAGAAFQARRVKLVPTRDPRLANSLAFENF
jgi:hypothetical protein